MKTTVLSMPALLATLCLLLIAAPATPPAQQPDPQLARRLQGIEQQVSKIRQLPLKQPITLEFKTRDELKSQVAKDVADQYTPAMQARDERVMTAFGLISPGTDLGQVQQNVLGEQIAGYYDTDTNQMVVVKESNGTSSFSAMDEFVFAHETTHALQDQNLNLDAITAREENDLDDQSLAILALIEGDATSCQVDYLLANKSLVPALSAQMANPGVSSAELDKAPAYIRDTLLFPYDQGLTFVDALKKHGGWDAVDGAYRKLPASTEQILHPEKYLAGEAPISVTIPDVGRALGSGWKSVTTNDLGELGVQILLSGQSDSKPDAKQAAAGWGGDRYEAWAHGDQTVLVWQTAWDSTDDAGQFTDALGAYEAQRWHTQADKAVASGQDWFTSAGAVTVVIPHGGRVSYVLAPDRLTAQRVVAALNA